MRQKIVVKNVARIIKKTQHRVRGYFLRLNLTKKREIDIIIYIYVRIHVYD